VQFIPTNAVRIKREAKHGDYKAILSTQNARIDIPEKVNKNIREIIRKLL